MSERTFRQMALALEGIVEAAHMGHPEFRAGGRIFATLKGDGKAGMVKLTPEEQARFVTTFPKAFAPENGAWGRQGCTRVDLGAVDDEALGEAMTLAWRAAMQPPARSRARRKPSR
jgi:hypothetical protein